MKHGIILKVDRARLRTSDNASDIAIGQSESTAANSTAKETSPGPDLTQTFIELHHEATDPFDMDKTIRLPGTIPLDFIDLSQSFIAPDYDQGQRTGATGICSNFDEIGTEYKQDEPYYPLDLLKDDIYMRIFDKFEETEAREKFDSKEEFEILFKLISKKLSPAKLQEDEVSALKTALERCFDGKYGASYILSDDVKEEKPCGSLAIIKNTPQSRSMLAGDLCTILQERINTKSKAIAEQKLSKLTTNLKGLLVKHSYHQRTKAERWVLRLIDKLKARCEFNPEQTNAEQLEEIYREHIKADEKVTKFPELLKHIQRLYKAESKLFSQLKRELPELEPDLAILDYNYHNTYLRTVTARLVSQIKEDIENEVYQAAAELFLSTADGSLDQERVAKYIEAGIFSNKKELRAGKINVLITRDFREFLNDEQSKVLRALKFKKIEATIRSLIVRFTAADILTKFQDDLPEHFDLGLLEGSGASVITGATFGTHHNRQTAEASQHCQLTIETQPINKSRHQPRLPFSRIAALFILAMACLIPRHLAEEEAIVDQNTQTKVNSTENPTKAVLSLSFEDLCSKTRTAEEIIKAKINTGDSRAEFIQSMIKAINAMIADSSPNLEVSLSPFPEENYARNDKGRYKNLNIASHPRFISISSSKSATHLAIDSNRIEDWFAADAAQEFFLKNLSMVQRVLALHNRRYPFLLGEEKPASSAAARKIHREMVRKGFY